MGLKGKLIGGGLGFLMGGPLGALIGGVIGHYVKDAPLADGEQPSRVESPESRRQREELYFVANLVGILAAMVKADGQVTPEEVQTVRNFFSNRLGYRGESLDIVRDMLKRALDTELNVEAMCLDFRGKSDYATRLLLMECLRDVAEADGGVHPEEERLLERVATLLGVAASDWRRGSSDFGAKTHGMPNDYEVLGLSPGASATEIKSAYRELAKKYHPDRVAHLGDEFKELAHKKFTEIQQAYDRLAP